MKKSRLQPGKPLVRRTPMPRGTTPLRRTELKRSSGIRSRGSVGDASPDGPPSQPNGPVKKRKPAKPGETAAEKRARDLVWARASLETGNPLCEVCGERPPTEYQHRKAKAHCTPAERWAVANGLAVCGHGNYAGCHGERIHQQPTEAYANGWSVLSAHDPLERWVLRRGVRVWFDDEGGFAAVEGSAA